MSSSYKLVKPLLILFLVVYFLHLVISRAPAELAAAAMHKAVPNLWLTGVEGTVWKGTANAAQIDLPDSPLPLGALNWHLSGWSLLTLSPCVTFDAGRTALLFSGRVCHSITGTSTLEDISLETSVAPLSELISVPVAGMGSVTIKRATIKDSKIERMEAQVSWQNGSVKPMEAWLNVGTYGASVLENSSGGVSAQIFQVDAPLEVQLVASWSNDQDWSVDGTVKPLDETPQLIKDGIPLIGEEFEPGNYRIHLEP